MSNSISYKKFKTFCFQSSCFIMLFLSGCNKVEDTKLVKNNIERTSQIQKDSFIYELNIYNAVGRLSVYKLTSAKPLTTSDSNIFMEESLKDVRKNINPQQGR